METDLIKIKKNEKGFPVFIALINDILNMSRIGSGKVQLERRSFDLKDMFDQIKSMFQQRAEDNGVDFQTAYSGGLTVFTIDLLAGSAIRL